MAFLKAKSAFTIHHDNEYEYYKVKRKDFKKFKSLCNSIKKLSKENKKIPAATIDTFFELLENINSRQSFKYVLEKLLLVEDFIEYLYKNKGRYPDYLFDEKKEKLIDLYPKSVSGKSKKSPGKYIKYGGFDTMIMYVVDALIKIQKENPKKWEHYFCVKQAYRSLREYNFCHMSFEQQLQYSQAYKFIVLSAMISDRIFGLWKKPVPEGSNVAKRYHTIGVNALNSKA